MDATSSPVNIDGLQPQQLGQVKRQLEDEVEHLTTSFTQLRAAQAKFKECLDSITIGLRSDKHSHILVPLTNSLYCRGAHSAPTRVLVDIGTGFFLEKGISSACVFYEGKVNDLESNLRDLETILHQKIANVQSVDGALRRKMQADSRHSP